MLRELTNGFEPAGNCPGRFGSQRISHAIVRMTWPMLIQLSVVDGLI
jgi:hypothetical protein